MNIKETVNNNRCRSCGYCSVVCQMDAIEIKYNMDTGFFRPQIRKDRCIECGQCIKYCPAENEIISIGLLGNYRDLLLAHATNREIRHNATSGGVVNSLIRFLLQKKIIDGALMARYDANSKIETSPQLITLQEISDLEKNTRDYSSRYVVTPILEGLKNIPSRFTNLAVVGTPCQIQALKLGKWKKDFDIFSIGITCSGGISYKATEQYKKLQNMPKSKMYYRGDGWPGKNCLISFDGRCLEFVHNGSLFERMFSSQIFKNPGCRKCNDHFAEQAEISFCDFWNTEERKTESEGNSCVIIRSERAKEYFNGMLETGFAEVVRKINEPEVLETQMHILKAKKGTLHNSVRYRVFIRIIDYIFNHNLYERFGIKEYNCFCRFYRKLCESQKL